LASSNDSASYSIILLYTIPLFIPSPLLIPLGHKNKEEKAQLSMFTHFVIEVIDISGQMKRQLQAPFPIPLNFIFQQFIKQLKFSYYALFYAAIFFKQGEIITPNHSIIIITLH